MNYIIDLIKTIFPDTQTAIFFIILTLITLWLYKQLQTRISENEKNTIVKTDKAVEVYAELDSEIRRFLKNKSDDISSLDAKLIKSSPHLPTAILVDFQEWVDKFEEDTNIEQLTKLQREIREEIRRLKHSQVDSITYKSNRGLTEFIRVYYKTKLSSIVEPIFHTGVGIFILMIMLLIASVFATAQEITDKVLLISLFAAMIVSILILDIIVIEIIAKGRFVHTIKNWLIFVAFIILSIILVFVGPWFRGILLIVITFAYAFYASTFSIKNLGKNKKSTE
ncbi:hypothetical protein RB620_21550 [Paenibacillus sp. LHD-117]|uniref:hypothetical protein n=1 Tax=Paenibacillus sp. LHD-117 TaxID=3071412 RepID=UPI0027E166A1|nr:hypothetical protein [Paenibacillus sp. LHD-117]MDQ6422019.1 hypothetical protein [Paenibacillus sp. LHD-117]